MKISAFAMLLALQPAYALVGRQGNYFQYKSTPTRPGSKDVYYAPPPVSATQEAEVPAAPSDNYFTTPRSVSPQSGGGASVSRTKTAAEPATAEPEKPAAPVRMVPARPATIQTADALETVDAEPVKATGLPPKAGDNSGLEHIFAQNQAWKASKLAEDPAFFDKLGTTHTPEYMWIGKANENFELSSQQEKSMN